MCLDVWALRWFSWSTVKLLVVPVHLAVLGWGKAIFSGRIWGAANMLPVLRNTSHTPMWKIFFFADEKYLGMFKNILSRLALWECARQGEPLFSLLIPFAGSIHIHLDGKKGAWSVGEGCVVALRRLVAATVLAETWEFRCDLTCPPPGPDRVLGTNTSQSEAHALQVMPGTASSSSFPLPALTTQSAWAQAMGANYNISLDTT